jgi:hypothetical protein
MARNVTKVMRMFAGAFPRGRVFCGDRFEVESVLGAGQFGCDLCCKDRDSVGRKVAVKLMFKEFVGSSQSLMPFFRRLPQGVRASPSRAGGAASHGVGRGLPEYSAARRAERNRG